MKPFIKINMFVFCLNVFLNNIEMIPRKFSNKRVNTTTRMIRMNPISLKTMVIDATKLTTNSEMYTKQFQYLKCMHNRKCWKTIPTKKTSQFQTNSSPTSTTPLNTMLAKTTELISTVSVNRSLIEDCQTKTSFKYVKNTTSQYKFNFSGLFSNFDPNVNMSYFNPLKLSSNQTGLLQNLKNGICWKKSYLRGVGSLITYCDPNKDNDGSLCYPKCKSGYTGLGPVCWKQCKPGYTDRGAFCIIDLDIYNKGCCCDIDEDCCNNCNATYVDDGCTCRRPPKSYPKKYYSRGPGKPLGCKPDEELSGLLCYPKCKSNYTGDGPICWQNCKSSFPIECGAACAVNSGNCLNKLINVGLAFGTSLGSIFAFQNIFNLFSLIDVTKIPFEFLAIQCYS